MTRAVAAAALALMAASLRLPKLADRPMHADEAILADKLGTLLDTGRYEYDPRDYHGPVLAYCALAPAHLTGRTSYPRLTESTLRIVPAIAGILLALSPLLFSSAIGFPAVWIAGGLLAVSSAAAYYSRDYIPETLLALWTAAFLWSLWKAGEKATAAWWALAGCLAGVMCATKETAVMALAGSAAAAILAWRPKTTRWRFAAAFASAFCLALSFLLAPPWRWGLIGSAAESYLHRGVTSGWHGYPWHYYLGLLTGVAGGPGELLIFALGLAGAAIAFGSGNQVLRFFAWYGPLIAVLYSAIPYKTPWCILSILYPFAILGGVAVGCCWRRRRLLMSALLTVVMIHSAWQAWLACTRDASDPHNQWVYAQTSTGVFKIRDKVADLARAAEQGRQVAVDVYSSQNLWPLPWYFRDYPNVHWWRSVPAQGRAAPIVLITPDEEPGLVRLLYQAPPPGERELYVPMFEDYVELRPSIEVRGYVSKQLRDRLGTKR